MRKGGRTTTSLSGVRLGELERTLLMAAPPIGALGGLVLIAPEGTRAAQQGYLRASLKLEAIGLIQRVHFTQAARARDPRREAPFYARGRFWRRAEATRRQVVSRVAIWVTPFGAGIRLVYERELTSRRPIRWMDRKIELARRYEATHRPASRSHEEAVKELESRLGNEAQDSPGPAAEAFPSEVRDEQQRARWRLAVQAARHSHPGLGSKRLWVEACLLYRSDEAEEILEARVARRQKSAADRPPLRFRRTDLGQILPTDGGLNQSKPNGYEGSGDSGSPSV